MVKGGQCKLGLTKDEFNILSLCYEEVFCYMAEESRGDKELTLTIRTSKTEGGFFTEVISGHKMDDINNCAVPETLLQVSSDELNKLGLLLFSQYAHDVTHLEISGYSFIFSQFACHASGSRRAHVSASSRPVLQRKENRDTGH